MVPAAPAGTEAGPLPARKMTTLPELLLQTDLAWQAGLAMAGGCLWLAALRRMLRDLRRPTAVGPHLARCGLPPEARPLAEPRAPGWPAGARPRDLAHSC